MVKVKNTSLKQTHIVIDRHMQSHEILPGQTKELEMVEDEISHFMNRRQFGHPIHIEGASQSVREKSNREVDPRDARNANRRQEGYNTDRGNSNPSTLQTLQAGSDTGMGNPNPKFTRFSAEKPMPFSAEKPVPFGEFEKPVTEKPVVLKSEPERLVPFIESEKPVLTEKPVGEVSGI